VKEIHKVITDLSISQKKQLGEKDSGEIVHSSPVSKPSTSRPPSSAPLSASQREVSKTRRSLFKNKAAMPIGLALLALIVILTSTGALVLLKLTKNSLLPTITTAPTNTQTTITATMQTIYKQVTSGTPAFSDSLTTPDNIWDVGSTHGACLFASGAYHVSIQQESLTKICFARSTNFC
jgi:hypothetical protein